MVSLGEMQDLDGGGMEGDERGEGYIMIKNK